MESQLTMHLKFTEDRAQIGILLQQKKMTINVKLRTNSAIAMLSN